MCRLILGSKCIRCIGPSDALLIFAGPALN